MTTACEKKRAASPTGEDPAVAPAPEPVPAPPSEPTPAPTDPAPPAPPPSPTPNLAACTTQVVDAGQKGSVAGVARGVYSDTKMIPSTSNPATAFTDPSAVSIKISFYNGTRFVREIVSGDGAASFVRLAFQSNGTPMVFWTLGANLKAAIRTAPLGSPGSWYASVIDTGVAPRAPEVSVNPLNQVALVYLTDTATTGRVKFLYCDAPCTNPAAFQVMAPNPYIENTNITAAQTAIGVAWCQASSTTYYPAAVYSTTGNVRYAVCKTSLSGCVSSANWTPSQVVASASVASKLLIDSSVVGDVAKVVALGAGGIVPYKMGSTLCTAAAGAFSAGSAIGGATSGNQWMSFLKDDDGKYHLAANEGVASVRYYNSTTTDPVAAWNTAGVVDTITLAAAHGGGAALDNAGLGLYLSYGTAAGTYDLKLGRVNDYTVASSSASLSRFSPDLTGNLQLGAANTHLKNTSAATTSEGVPALAYVDYSVGAAAAAKLKYALRTGPTSASPFEANLIPGTVGPAYPSLAFDELDMPWISYFDSGTNRFYLTTNSRTDGSGNWTTYEFPAIPAGAAIALPAANNTALAMRKVAGVAKPVMIVLNTNVASKGVRAAMFNPSNQSWSAVATVDGLTAGSLGGAHLTAASDSSGNLVMAFQDLNLTRVKYAYSTNGVDWSTPITLSAIGQGVGATIAVNPFTQKPAVTYYDQTNNSVYYSPCSGLVSECGLSGLWTAQRIESAAGVSGLGAASGQLLTTALAFSPTGFPWILYPRGQGNDGNLALTTNASGTWIASIHSAGVNGSLPGTPAMNFGVAGWNVAASLNAVGGLVSTYIGPGNTLYSTSCGD